jgi:hypothetical protein
MARRFAKWFTITPPNAASGPAWATYNGQDRNGNRDPIGEGQVGVTYPVIMYSLTKLEAPNPPFNTGENFRIDSKAISSAVESQLSRYKPKPAKQRSASGRGGATRGGQRR